MRPRPAVLLTRNPTKDFYPERPSGVTDLSSSHMSIPIQSVTVHLSSALTKNTAPFVFKRLRTFPSSVSRKSCSCRSYENGRVCIKQFPFRNSYLSARQPAPRLLRWCRRFLPLCALCAFCGLCAKSFFSFLSTFNFQLWTLNLRLLGAYPLSFQILADSFALSKNSTPLFSRNSGLFARNTRGWGGATPHNSPVGSILWVAI